MADEEKKRVVNSFLELQRNEVISKPSVLGMSCLVTRRETFIYKHNYPGCGEVYEELRTSSSVIGTESSGMTELAVLFVSTANVLTVT